ncbi:hypothetical protein AB0I50_49535, partial [Streptomyces prunicolor]
TPGYLWPTVRQPAFEQQQRQAEGLGGSSPAGGVEVCDQLGPWLGELVDREQRAPDEGLLDDGDLAAPCAFTRDEDEDEVVAAPSPSRSQDRRQIPD